MTKKRLVALLAACMMMLSACGAPQAPADGSVGGDTQSAQTETTEEEVPEEEYTGPKDYQGWTTSMATFNPQMYTNSKTFLNQGTLVAMVADKEGNNTLQFVPYHAAELPTTSDGGTTWNIKIRQQKCNLYV